MTSAPWSFRSVLLLLLWMISIPWLSANDVIPSRGWDKYAGQWTWIQPGIAKAGPGFAMLLRKDDVFQDGIIRATVTYEHEAASAASGIAFRMSAEGTGYYACFREVDKGVDANQGEWERPVIQLYRIDKNGWKLLQESKIMGARSSMPRRLTVAAKGPDLFVYDAETDAATPVIREYDDAYPGPGRVGVFKDVSGSGSFADFSLQPVLGASFVWPAPSLRTGWSWVRGAIYVRSTAVNAVEMWHDYWPHVDTVDRELALASLYGFNMVQVYLHWIIWDHDSRDYLKRIDDFLTRAAKHGLKVNFILWDDCGHVEPSLTFAAPVPGRHNSQMMPNPSHRIRDSVSELNAHHERFGSYIQGVAGHFKDDPRIAFWQLYNEAMGARERYRTSDADGNINRLLEWTRVWVKGTGTKIPVTATGGGFYGPKYSDFPTYHSYSPSGQPLPNADGGPEHLCTETLNRPGAPLASCLGDLAGKKNGFVVWELMIGRDNCRYPWGHPDGFAEPSEPFHGVIYPDGHPWSVEEVRALLGEERFSRLLPSLFTVEYFKGRFERSMKQSIMPWIDFNLGDESGTGSPDASAALAKDDFSIRWTGTVKIPASGRYTFYATADGTVRVIVNGVTALEKTLGHSPEEVEGTIDLKPSDASTVAAVVEYGHQKGNAHCRIQWSGPSFDKRIFQP